MKNTTILFLRSTFGVGSQLAKNIHKRLGLNNRKSPLLTSEKQKKKILLNLRPYTTGIALKHVNLEYNSFKEVTKTYIDFKKLVKIKRKKQK